MGLVNFSMVYVDQSRYSLGRMQMCHMIADTPKELYHMADKIGVRHKWLQYPGSYKEHFDICLTKRKLAVAAGAVELTTKDLARKLLARRPK